MDDYPLTEKQWKESCERVIAFGKSVAAISIKPEPYAWCTIKIRPWPFNKWWQRHRIVDITKDGPLKGAPIYEFYTPWWAWPFEILHRIIFPVKIEKDI